MGWRILIGIATLVGFGTAVTEYDNIQLETSPAGQNRKLAQRPVFTATYGVAPGEYVLRGSDSEEANTPPPIQGYNFLPRDQAPPQEYLDLLRQAGVEDGVGIPQQPPQRQQTKGTARVIDQQYYGVHANAPYPPSGITPVSSLGLPPSSTKYTQVAPEQTQPSLIPVAPYPPRRNQVAPVNFVPSSPYVTPLPDTTPTNNKNSKPESVSNTRKTTGGGRTNQQDQPQRGSGKAVQLTYSLDYDLRTLRKEVDTGSSRPSSSSVPYYPTAPGSVVKGDGDLLSKLAPAPEPLPFPISGSHRYGSSQNTKQSKTKPSSGIDDEDEGPKIEVIKLPTPKGQRPITQEELNELIQAGYDVRPADEEEVKDYRPNLEHPSPLNPQGYSRTSAPRHQLRLPKSRPAEATPPATRYFSAPKTQEPSNVRSEVPHQNTYVSSPGSAPNLEETVPPYYRTPVSTQLPLIRQKTIQPNIQAYQPGRSGIQHVDEGKVGQQVYRQDGDRQTQIHHTPGTYVSHGYPTPDVQGEHLNPQIHSYPIATAQEQPQQENQHIANQQAQLYHHQQLAQHEALIYQQPQTTETRNEALSHPKEYVIPAPQGPKEYGTRVNKAASDDSPPPGYESIPTAPGVSAGAGETPTRNHQGREGYGRRNSRRRPSSQRESRIVYVRRYQGEPTGYATEQ